jgi:hypothetical protein
VRQGGHNLALNGDPMRVDLIVECLAEGNCVFSSLVGGHRLIVVVEPEMELIKKVEAC